MVRASRSSSNPTGGTALGCEITRIREEYIASISDVSSGVIELVVHVTADQTTDDEAKRLWIMVSSLVGTTCPEQQSVMVQTAGDVTSN